MMKLHTLSLLGAVVGATVFGVTSPAAASTIKYSPTGGSLFSVSYVAPGASANQKTALGIIGKTGTIQVVDGDMGLAA